MCGGLLDIDLDRQMYICPFCGVTFDYEYFREDNVLEIANKSLNRSEFGAAKDAFDFILQKDPHDFQALRGLILCRCKWKNLLPMMTYNQVHLREDDPCLVSAIENCHPEKKEYFEKIDEAGNSTQWIVPTAQKYQMEPLLVVLQPHSELEEDKPHTGEEFGFLISGRLNLYLGDKVYHIRAGESFYYQAAAPHRIVNPGNRPAKLIWVSSPPSF